MIESIYRLGLKLQLYDYSFLHADCNYFITDNGYIKNSIVFLVVGRFGQAFTTYNTGKQYAYTCH